MPITVSGTSITFNDATVQTTAPSASFSGSTTTTGSSALTLTSASTQYQVVQISSYANSIVNLPNATTLTTKGFAPYVIANNSPLGAQLTIKNNAGTVIGALAAGRFCTIALTDNSTTAGTWAIEEATSGQAVATINDASFTTATQAVSYKPYYVGLTSTLFVRIWINSPQTASTLNIYYQAFTISGSTITAGAIASDNLRAAGGSTLGVVKPIRLSNTAFVVLRGTNFTQDDGGWTNSGEAVVYTCTVSGTTITRGTASTLVSSALGNIQNATLYAAYNGKLTRLSDTSYAVTYNSAIDASYATPDQYSGSLACKIITVSGTTQTVGTAVNLGTSTYTQPISMCALSSTLAFVCYNQWSLGVTTATTKMVTISISGTTPTWNTPVSLDTARTTAYGVTNNVNNAVAVSASQAIFSTIYSTAEASIATTVPTFDMQIQNTFNWMYLTGASTIFNGTNYLFPVTGGFTQSANITTVLQTNATYSNGSLSSPLGAQPTTAWCGDINTYQAVLIGTTQ